MSGMIGFSRLRCSIVVALVCVATTVVAGAASAASWNPVRTLATGVPGYSAQDPASPVQLAAGPHGAVALAFQGPADTVELTRRSFEGGFGQLRSLRIGGPRPPRGPARFDPPKYPFLFGLALPGRSAVVFASDPDASIIAQVQPHAGGGLSAPQTLVPGIAGNGAVGSATFATTSRGEVIADIAPNHDNIQAERVSVLAAGARRFSDLQTIGRIACGGSTGEPLAVDALGTAFLAADRSCKHTSKNTLWILRRPARGRLSLSRVLPCRGCQYAVAAAGDGDVAVSRILGWAHGLVALAVGRHGRLGRSRAVGRVTAAKSVPPGATAVLNAPYVQRRGQLTASWSSCRYTGEDCNVMAMRADVHGRLGRPRRLLAHSTREETIQTIDGPGDVLVAVCQHYSSDHCTLKAWFRGRGRSLSLGRGRLIVSGFRTPPAGTTLTVDTDAAGDQLIPLAGDDGSIRVAVRTTGSRHFSVHELAPAGTFPRTSLQAIVTSRREAVIAWRTKHGSVRAAVYRFPSPSRR
jgi:hypothetical protein